MTQSKEEVEIFQASDSQRSYGYGDMFTSMPEVTEDVYVMSQAQAEKFYKELVENPPASENPLTTALRAMFEKT